jgi:hypothetical protein
VNVGEYIRVSVLPKPRGMYTFKTFQVVQLGHIALCLITDGTVRPYCILADYSFPTSSVVHSQLHTD